jgi:hypothetical protein
VKEVIISMSSELQNKPFKDREHVRAEIRRCALAGSVFAYVSFLFVALGVISSALNTTLGLQPLIWFLLAIFACIHAIVPEMHLVVAKQVYGIEGENEKE